MTRDELDELRLFILGYRFPLFAWAAGNLETFYNCQKWREARPWWMGRAP